MKVIPEVKGELLADPSIEVIIHQCKTTNKFDVGLASQIKQMYPKAWLADVEAAKHGKNVLGSYSWAQVTPTKYVFNVYSSSTVDVNKRYTDYDALRKSLSGAKWYIANMLNNPVIGIGHIGCGPGNGDWNIVRKIVSEVFTDYQGEIKIIDIPGA